MRAKPCWHRFITVAALTTGVNTQQLTYHRQLAKQDGASEEELIEGTPEKDLIPSLLAASDVLGTGWFAAHAADVRPGKSIAVVGNGAVGLLGVLAALSTWPGVVEVISYEGELIE
jgi:Zn-dependent alcohol dehydrogenase